jgi:hypothetical protein
MAPGSARLCLICADLCLSPLAGEMYIITPGLGSGQYHHGVSKVSGDRAVLVVSICGRTSFKQVAKRHGWGGPLRF